MECILPIKKFIISIWNKLVQKVEYIKNRYFTNKPMSEKSVEITNINKDKKIDDMEKGIEEVENNNSNNNSNNISNEVVIDINDNEYDSEDDTNTIINRKNRKRKIKRINSSDKISEKWETIDLPNIEDQDINNKSDEQKEDNKTDKKAKTCVIH